MNAKEIAEQHLKHWHLNDNKETVFRAYLDQSKELAEAKRKGHKIRLIGEGELDYCDRCNGGEVELEVSCAERLLERTKAAEKELTDLKERLENPTEEMIEAAFMEYVGHGNVPKFREIIKAANAVEIEGQNEKNN